MSEQRKTWDMKMAQLEADAGDQDISAGKLSRIVDVNKTLSPDATKLLNELRANVESEDGLGDGRWGTVYLDNCNHGFSGKRLSGLYGVLAKAGLYKELDGYAFGLVKLVEDEP